MAQVEPNQSTMESIGYEDPALQMSVGPSSAAAPVASSPLAAPAEADPLVCSATSPRDAFVAPPAESLRFNFNTAVSLSRPGLGAGDERTSIPLGELLIASGSEDCQIAARAQEELTRWLREQLPTQAEAAPDQSYDDPNRDIANALAHLVSPDPADRRAGAQILILHVMNNTEDVHLRRGLMVCLAKINNAESRRAIVQIYHQSQQDPQLREVLNFPNSHEVLTIVAQENPNSNFPARALALAGGELGGGGWGGEMRPPATAAIDLSTRVLSAGQTALLNQLTQIVMAGFSRLPDLAPITDHAMAEGVAHHFLRISQDPAIGPEQWAGHFRLGILGAAFNHPEFTSAHFIQLQGVATAIGDHAAARLLGRHETSLPLASAPFSWIPGPAANLPLTSPSRPSAPATTPGPSTARGFLDALMQWASHDGTAAATLASLPVLTLASAGLQGALSFTVPGASLPPARTLGSDQPSYFIEGSTAIDGEGNEDMGGNSGGHGEGREQQDSYSPQDFFTKSLRA